MAKQIGKGKIILIEGDMLTLETDCMNGESVTTAKYVFSSSESDDELAIDDTVVFVEEAPPGEGEGEAINVVKVPPNGCM